MAVLKHIPIRNADYAGAQTYLLFEHDEKERLLNYQIGHAEKDTRISKKNPVPHGYSILTVHTEAGYTHRTLLYHGKYHDPEFGLICGEYPHGKNHIVSCGLRISAADIRIRNAI